MENRPPQDLCALYCVLTSANHDAFAQELFKVAYYALAGAMQCALELKDKDKMAEIGCLAHDQLLELQAYFPDEVFGSKSNELVLYRSLVRLVDVRGFLLGMEPTKQID